MKENRRGEEECVSREEEQDYIYLYPIHLQYMYSVITESCVTT